MAAPVRLRVYEPTGTRVVALDGERFTIGKAQGNDLVVDDASTSRLHVVCEAAGPMWTITDAGSTNGTWVNGKRIFGAQALHDGDRISIGVVAIVVAVERVGSDTETDALAPPPHLTARDREVLAALCRPVIASSVMTEPSSVREMAAALSVSESAVKKALGRLYSKFGLHDDERRRGRLAMAAIRSGAGGQPPE